VTQSTRLLAYLYTHPGATSLEITHALALVNVTGRVSDLRAAGHDVVCARRSDGRQGYRVVERKPVLRGEQVGMAL
jgi:hypothetical protein